MSVTAVGRIKNSVAGKKKNTNAGRINIYLCEVRNFTLKYDLNFKACKQKLKQSSFVLLNTICLQKSTTAYNNKKA